MDRPGRPNSWTLGPTWRTLAVAVVIVMVITSSQVQGNTRRSSRLARCEQPPRFSVNGVEPMALAQGKVTLVALLTNTCSFCIRQSEMLAVLYQQLNDADDEGVSMMIVDAGPPPQRPQDGVFERRVPFSVYHDDEHRTIWRQVFKGSKDDILVFNQCGMLTYHIRFPYSYLGYRFVRRAINITASGRFCAQQCPRGGNSQGLQHRMQGDAPMPDRRHGAHYPILDDSSPLSVTGQRRGGRGGRGGRHGVIVADFLRGQYAQRCLPTDALCRELRRKTRRYNRFLSAHGLTRQAAKRNELHILEILRRFRRRQDPTAL